VSGAYSYLKSERPIENIQVYGEMVVVTGHAKLDVSIEGKPELLDSRYADVRIKRVKRWQMMVWQSTPISRASGLKICCAPLWF